jgi:CheY-like chemotaxis protein
MSGQALFLLIEDTENDVLLIQRAFIKAKILNPLLIVKTAEEAVAYLQGEGRYSNRIEFPLPELILLDLKLPGMDGFDFLRWIRRQEGLATMRVVVLTSSDLMRDVNLAYQLGANSFLVKPVDFERFVEISQALNGFWMWTSKAPDTYRAAERDNNVLVDQVKPPTSGGRREPPAREKQLPGY